MEAAKKYDEYVGEIAEASKVTGISAHNMSVLGTEAKTTGVSMETLTTGITFLERSLGQAIQGNAQAVRGFQQLHITQSQLVAGQKDFVPFLELVAQRFHALSHGAAQTTVAMELAGRGGRSMVPFLNALAEEGLKKVEERAKELGVAIGEKDVQAYEEHRVAMTHLHEMMEGFEILIGSKVQPRLNDLLAWFIAAPTPIMMTASIISDWGKNFAHVMDNLVAEAESVGHALTFHFNAAGRDLERAGNDLILMGDDLDRITRSADLFGTSSMLAFAKAKQEVAKLAALMHGEDGKGGALDFGPEQAGKAMNFYALMAEGVKLYMESLKRAQEEMAKWDEMAQQGAEETARVSENIAKETATATQSTIATITGWIQTIDFKEEQHFAEESAKMREHLNQIVRANETTYEHLANDYQADLLKYSAAEEAKAVADVRNTGHEAEVHQQFAAMRAALLTQYGNDLMKLYNSQGWQAVFGSKFAQMLKGDEAALKEWATSANQSALLAQNAMTMMAQQGREAFDQLSDGMGGAIAHALVYGGSMGRAMREAAAATLESIAAKDIVLAIDAAAWGFYDLAMGNYAGASAAFTAAAIFGSVGAAAGTVGHFMNPGSQTTGAGSQSGRSGSAGASGGYGAGGGSQPGSAPIQQGGPGVHVYVQGNLVGWQNIDELTSAINDAVLNRDVTLTATNTTTGVQVVK